MSRDVIRFITNNQYKIQEAKSILEKVKVTVKPIELKINELQTEDTKCLIKNKAMQAFQKIGRPLFVEHTGLYLKHLNGLPGGLTQIFWDTLQADRFCELFGKTSDPTAIARTVIGYIDGKTFYSFMGEIDGVVSPEPRGSRDFQWDCVFIPKSYDKTFAELGDKKNDISMRKNALDEFSKHLLTKGSE